ncbi:heterokaryon incompatibility protein-domain-containing protein [Apiosordaria backusii]|uniref:Heterokaryon incompatibility protein-domain-containing protein n=1 Tax=Apiosordaria backusii TaxID=314023 RepID=A0AA40ETL0_9PEZI|nr:heterokaryon incompatibility protein-domain-containing protein [Apiosordaria backusii]
MTSYRSDEFAYDPIDLDGPAFRLLRIVKGRDPSIPCKLFQAKVRQREVAISYEAISYVWGSPERERDVFINGFLFGVTKSLYEALWYLQLEDEDRVIWVDAICIDQKNEVERGHQVRHMGDVYKEAVRVIYWLGPPTHLTNLCLGRLQLLHEETRRVATRTWTREQWRTTWENLEASSQQNWGFEREGLCELLGRSWFRRVWILQEVANSQAALVCSGHESVSAKVFGLAPFLMGVTPEPHCQGILDMMPGPFRESSWFTGSRDLYTLLGNFGGSEATEERDLVYALLGLSSDAAHVIQPDYQTSEGGVIRTVFAALFHVHLNHHLDTIPASIRELCTRLTFFNELALEAAASNEAFGDAVMAFNLTRRPCLAISERTVRAAARNKRKGPQIINIILDNCEKTSRSLTPGHGSALIEGAAENAVSGDQVLRLFFSRTSHRPPVTENALVLAARNELNGDKILGLLFHECTITRVPSRAIAAAFGNGKCGYEIVLKFWNLQREESCYIIEGVFRAAASIGADVRDNTSPLFVDVQRNLGHMITIFLGAGADPSIQNKKHGPGCNTRLRYVKPAGHNGLADLLVRSGADLELPNNENQAPLILAAWLGRVAIVQPYTPLLWPVTGGLAEAAKRLIQAGANIEAESLTHKSMALHLAARHNRPVAFEVLLENGSDINTEDRDVFTFLERAISRGHPDKVQLLLIHSVKMNTVKTKPSLGSLRRWVNKIQLQTAKGWKLCTRTAVEKGQDGVAVQEHPNLIPGIVWYIIYKKIVVPTSGTLRSLMTAVLDGGGLSAILRRAMKLIPHFEQGYTSMVI